MSQGTRLVRVGGKKDQTVFFCIRFITKKQSMHKNDLIALVAIVITLVNAVVVLIRYRNLGKSKNKNNRR
jgi:hypothetical protein